MGQMMPGKPTPNSLTKNGGNIDNKMGKIAKKAKKWPNKWLNIVFLESKYFEMDLNKSDNILYHISSILKAPFVIHCSFIHSFVRPFVCPFVRPSV